MSQQSLNYEIAGDKWKNIYETYAINCGSKIRLAPKFVCEFLMIILLSFDLKCSIKCRYNWFKELESRKVMCAYWRGLFDCKYCKTKFEALIQNGPTSNALDNLIVNIKYIDQNICLKKIEIVARCTGEKRMQLASEIASKGYSKLKSENLIYNSAFPDNDRNYLF